MKQLSFVRFYIHAAYRVQKETYNVIEGFEFLKRTWSEVFNRKVVTRWRNNCRRSTSLFLTTFDERKVPIPLFLFPTMLLCPEFTLSLFAAPVNPLEILESRC